MAFVKIMELIKQPTHLLVCRSAFCVKCWQRGKPQKKDIFLVYGTNHQNFKEKQAHHDGFRGYVPHLYTIETPFRLDEDGKVVAVRVCLMDGCGIQIGKLKADGNFNLKFLNPETVLLTQNAVEALVTLWRGTGYELI